MPPVWGGGAVSHNNIKLMARGWTSFVFFYCYQDNAKHEEAQEDEADDQQSSGSGETADEEDTFGKKSILIHDLFIDLSILNTSAIYLTIHNWWYYTYSYFRK